jgi:CRT-like protein similar to chloroquine-resistance transporter
VSSSESEGGGVQPPAALLHDAISRLFSRVLFKLMLVPMKNHWFFVANLSTFLYVPIFFCVVLYNNYKVGYVDR